MESNHHSENSLGSFHQGDVHDKQNGHNLLATNKGDRLGGYFNFCPNFTDMFLLVQIDTKKTFSLHWGV